MPRAQMGLWGLCLLIPILFASLCAPLPVLAQDTEGPPPAETPRLRIGTEQHLGAIHALTVNPDGSLIATAGVDKTVRLWDPADGRLVQVLRTPIGDGPDGIVYSTTFNRRGNGLLAGGVSYGADGKNGLFNIRPGKNVMRNRLPLEGGLRQIARGRGADGKTRYALAVSWADGTGAVVIRSGRYKRLLFDRFDAIPESIAFVGGGGLIAVTSAGELRRYEGDALAGTMALSQGAVPAVVRVSPNGTLIAIGYWNRRQIEIRRLSDLQVLARLTGPSGAQTAGADNLHFNAIAWQANAGVPGGGGLWAGGSYAELQTGQTILRHWPDLGRPGRSRDVPVSEDVITALEPLPDGGIAFAAADPAWGVVEPDLSLRYRHTRPSLDFRAVWRDRQFAIDEAAGRLMLPLETTGTRDRVLVFDVPDARLSIEPRIPQPAARGESTTPSWRFPEAPPGLEDYAFHPRPRWNGVPIPLLPNEKARAADAVIAASGTPHGDPLPEGGFVLGADRGVYLHDAAGLRLAWVTTATATFAVKTLSDGRILAAHEDGTVRWYRRHGKKLIEDASLFVRLPYREAGLAAGDQLLWLAWAPDGRFMHAPNGGQRLAGFHIGRGPEALAKWVDFSQTYAEFYDPDRVTAALEGRLSTPPETDPSTPEPDAAGTDPEPAAAAAVASAAPEVTITEICPIIEGTEQPCFAADLATRGLGAIEAKSAKETNSDVYADGVRLVGAEVEQVRLRYRIENLDGLPSKIDVFHNSVTSGADLVTRGLGAIPVADPETKAITGARDVFLTDGINQIVLRIYDQSGAFGVSRELALFRPRTDAPEERPVLHVLAIGADAYGGDLAPLRFAASDADSVAHAITAQPARAYRDVAVHRMTGDEAVSRDAILERLEALSEEVDEGDAVIVYLAGHGIQTEAGRYVFVPPEVTQADQIVSGGLDQDALVAAIGRLRARHTLLMLDTCHAGAFEPPRRAAGAMSNESGFMVIAAAAPESEALDGYDSESGVFAHAVEEGLTGGAALGGPEVEAAGLGLYLARRVPTLAAERNFSQRPVVMNPLIDSIFPITEAIQ